MFTKRTLSAIGEFLKNSTRSGDCIDSKWLRALLALHLMVTAIGIVAFFPPIISPDVSVEYGAHVLQWLVLIAICGLSARLAWGLAVARQPFWIAHGLWVLSVLVGVTWYWGAFADHRPWDASVVVLPDGGLMFRPWYIRAGIWFASLSLLYSGIPIFVRIWKPRVGKLVEETGPWGCRGVSLVSFVAGVSLYVVFFSTSSETVLLLSLLPLLLSCVIAAVGVTRGDGGCFLILVGVPVSVGVYGNLFF